MKRYAVMAVVASLLLALSSGAALAATLVVGTENPDRLRGTGLNERIEGRGGDDRITGGGGVDRVLAGPGDDFVNVGYHDDGTTPDRVDCGPGKDTVQLTRLKIAPCRACDICQDTDEFCVHGDDFPPLWEQMKTSDVWVLGTPIYWGGPTAQFKAFLDRWRAPEEELKVMPDQHIILALALGDEGGEQAQITVDMLTVGLDWINKTIN